MYKTIYTSSESEHSSESDSSIKAIKKSDKNGNKKLKADTNTKVNQKSEGQLKNYLFDNTNLKETNQTTEFNANELNIDSDEEVFILQCPKSFHPKQMIGQNIGNLKEANLKFAFDVDLFQSQQSLSVIIPQKNSSDKLKLIKPIGKISISEKFTVPELSQQFPESPKIKPEPFECHDVEPEVASSKSPKKSSEKVANKRKREKTPEKTPSKTKIKEVSSPKQKKVKSNRDKNANVEFSWLTDM